VRTKIIYHREDAWKRTSLALKASIFGFGAAHPSHAKDDPEEVLFHGESKQPSCGRSSRNLDGPDTALDIPEPCHG